MGFDLLVLPLPPEFFQWQVLCSCQLQFKDASCIESWVVIDIGWNESRSLVLLSPCQVKSKQQRATSLITTAGIFDRLCPTEDVFDLCQFQSTTTFCELEARSPSVSFQKNFRMTPPAARRGTMGNFRTVRYFTMLQDISKYKTVDLLSLILFEFPEVKTTDNSGKYWAKFQTGSYTIAKFFKDNQEEIVSKSLTMFEEGFDWLRLKVRFSR